MAHSAQKGKILAVIGDEDTVVGFLLGGVGELNKVCVLLLAVITSVLWWQL